jgi:hypothetical protein
VRKASNTVHSFTAAVVISRSGRDISKLNKYKQYCSRHYVIILKFSLLFLNLRAPSIAFARSIIYSVIKVCKSFGLQYKHNSLQKAQRIPSDAVNVLVPGSSSGVYLSITPVRLCDSYSSYLRNAVDCHTHIFPFTVLAVYGQLKSQHLRKALLNQLHSFIWNAV